MPRLRRFGNALGDVGSTLMQHVLQLEAQKQQSELVRARQMELARLNAAEREAAREDSQAANEQSAILGDPTGAKAQMLVDAGKSQYAGFVPTGQTATTRFGAGFNQAKNRTELPTDVGVELGLGASPGGRDAAKDPRNIMALIGQRDARKAAFDTEDATQVKLQQDKAFAEGKGRGLGTEAADATAFPAKLQREKDTYAQMTPLHARRAAGEAAARESAQTRGAADRERQSWELAAQNPLISGMAEQVIAGTPLKEVPAEHRGYVMAALRSEKYAPQSRKKAEEILNTGWNALQRMKGNQPGLEGFTGNALFDPSRWTWSGNAVGGTATGDFQSNFEQFVSATALDKIDFLRGMGHLSDADMIIIKTAGTNLSQRMRTGTFSSGMDEAEAAMRRAYQRLGIEPPATGSPANSGPVDILGPQNPRGTVPGGSSAEEKRRRLMGG